MKKVFCLYRVSTKGQVDKDDIPMQKIACREFCEKNNWTIVKEFCEKGISGYKISSEKRDAIQSIKKSALNKEFDVLLVFMFDRLGRRDDETPFVVEWFSKNGIEVWSTKEGEQRFDSHVDKLTNYLRFWQSSGESIKTAERVKTRMKQLTEQGYYTGGPVFYGYKAVKKGRYNKKGHEVFDFEIDEVEAEYVRFIFEKTLKDGRGVFEIATLLNNKGCNNKRGAKFNGANIRRILRNPIYCGYIKFGDTISPKLDELVIIDEDTFKRVNEILDKRKKVYDEKAAEALHKRGRGLISGFVFCGCCGGRISVTQYYDKYTRKDGSINEIRKLKYRCQNKAKKIKECNGNTTYQLEKVDEIVDKTIGEIFEKIKQNPVTITKNYLEKVYKEKEKNSISKQKKLSFEKKKLEEQLIKLREEIIKSLMGESHFTQDLLSQTIKSIEKNLQDVSSELETISLENKKNLNNFKNISLNYEMFKTWANQYQELDMEQRKSILMNMVDKVKLKKDYDIDIELKFEYKQLLIS